MFNIFTDILYAFALSRRDLVDPLDYSLCRLENMNIQLMNTTEV